MNERIREIAKQANAHETGHAYYRGEKKPENAVTLHSVDLELFAKLIVLECADLVEGFEMTQQFAPDVIMNFEASSVLKEQFGVEE